MCHESLGVSRNSQGRNRQGSNGGLWQADSGVKLTDKGVEEGRKRWEVPLGSISRRKAVLSESDRRSVMPCPGCVEVAGRSGEVPRESLKP
jgi:hypothetical protein